MNKIVKSSTLATGLALAGLLVSQGEPQLAVAVYGLYCLKEAVRLWQTSPST